MEQERRVKIFYMSYAYVTSVGIPTQHWTRVQNNNLPKDAKIISVHQSYQGGGGFDFVVSSKEFDEVSPGSMPDRIDFLYEIKELKHYEIMDGLKVKEGSLFSLEDMEEYATALRILNKITSRVNTGQKPTLEMEGLVKQLGKLWWLETTESEKGCHNCASTEPSNCIFCPQDNKLSNWTPMPGRD